MWRGLESRVRKKASKDAFFVFGAEVTVRRALKL